MPDSSRCSVSLLYLHFLEDVARARTYSWGSAVLTEVYRELCTSPQADKNSNAGALFMWIQYHDHIRSTTNIVRVYRDIFDRLMADQFIWEPYDFTSPGIAGLGPICLTENWMSQCPLINIDIVEIHHLNRVLSQFGMI
ncbi:hypothetical protein ACS0TY_008504 [Phlomoides rotata]